MRKYRFVTKTHEDIVAENVDEAIAVFRERKERGLCLRVDEVTRIEVLNEAGEFEPIDRPLRAGDVITQQEMHAGFSA